jgi:hypothetical protein
VPLARSLCAAAPLGSPAALAGAPPPGGGAPLVTLLLDHNAIGDAGVTALAEGLRGNRALTLLSLAYCQIGPAGGAVLGAVVLPSSGAAPCSASRARRNMCEQRPLVTLAIAAAAAAGTSFID